MTKKLNPPIKEAVDFFGSQHKMARKLKVSQMAVYKWLHSLTTPCAKNALRIQVLTKNRVKAQDILPCYTEEFFVTQLKSMKATFMAE